MLEINVRVRLNCVGDGYLLAFNYKIMDASMWDKQKHPAIFNLDCFSNAFFKAECAKDNSGGFI